MIKGSWKTSLAGILTIVAAISTAVLSWLKTGVIPDLAPIIAAVTAGAGLLFSRDNNVSSEAAGIK